MKPINTKDDIKIKHVMFDQTTKSDYFVQNYMIFLIETFCNHRVTHQGTNQKGSMKTSGSTYNFLDIKIYQKKE